MHRFDIRRLKLIATHGRASKFAPCYSITRSHNFRITQPCRMPLVEPKHCTMMCI